MTKRLVIIFGLVGFLISVSCIRPISAMACSCETTTINSSYSECNMVGAISSPGIEWYCERVSNNGACAKDTCSSKIIIPKCECKTNILGGCDMFNPPAPVFGLEYYCETKINTVGKKYCESDKCQTRATGRSPSACTCDTVRYSAGVVCKIRNEPPVSDGKRYYCKESNQGSCMDNDNNEVLSVGCTTLTNSLDHPAIDTCKCDIATVDDPSKGIKKGDGIINPNEMFCNDRPPKGEATKLPHCVNWYTVWGCRCKTQEEIDNMWREDSAKWAIGNSGPEDVFCAGAGKDTTNPKINTSIGCIPVDIIQVVAWIFEKGFGIVGGIAFILLIGAFIQLATSEGDVKKIQGAKELITSIVTGLLLAIFSIFIIRLLMITILRIPLLK